MASISKILLRLKTPSCEGVGTDGDVFLGIAGREFYIDSVRDGFEMRDDHTYVLGEGDTILESEFYPRDQELDTEDIFKFPSYIRFEPRNRADNWLLNMVQVTVNPGPNQIFLTRRRRSDSSVGRIAIWLGQKRGKILYLEVMGDPR